MNYSRKMWFSPTLDTVAFCFRFSSEHMCAVSHPFVASLNTKRLVIMKQNLRFFKTIWRSTTTIYPARACIWIKLNILNRRHDVCVLGDRSSLHSNRNTLCALWERTMWRKLVTGMFKRPSSSLLVQFVRAFDLNTTQEV